jgi:hypothetical protein
VDKELSRAYLNTGIAASRGWFTGCGRMRSFFFWKNFASLIKWKHYNQVAGIAAGRYEH